jgi:regulator of nonsense transcripts 3
MASPKVALAKPPRHGSTNGILPAPATMMQSTRSREGKAPGPRLKVVIRRLPPGLIKDEFIASLGDDWLLNTGWVDWMIFKPGKISTEYVES